MKTIQDYPTINERPPEGLKSDGTAFKVLVIDDSMFVAKQLGQILASEGYDVVATAVDGAEGVVGGLGAGLGERVEQGALADVRQTYDS